MSLYFMSSIDYYEIFPKATFLSKVFVNRECHLVIISYLWTNLTEPCSEEWIDVECCVRSLRNIIQVFENVLAKESLYTERWFEDIKVIWGNIYLCVLDITWYLCNYFSNTFGNFCFKYLLDQTNKENFIN